MAIENWKPRMSINLDPETYAEYQILLPHGTKQPVMNALLKSLLKLLRDSGKRQLIIGMIMSEQITAEDLLPIERKKEK